MSEPERQTVTREHEGQVTPAPTPIDLPPRWRPIRFLGQGGQGQVWLVEDSALREQVALKVLAPSTSPANHERLRREVRVGRSLQHPGLIRVHDLHEDGERLMVAMEYLPGGTLAARLDGGPLPVEEVFEVARQVLAALAHLHDHRVVHRDVKPSNLLLDEHGRVKLADLGLARALDETMTLTGTGAALGTLAYMSPEQLLGQEVGPPADLYGVGVTLHELLTGERPARGGSTPSGASPLLPGPPASLRPLRPDCPLWLDRFVRRLLEPRPRDRYPDARTALDALLARRGRRSPRVWRARLAAAAGVALATSVTALLLTTHPEVATVTHEGSTVLALDGRGRTLWRHQSAGEVSTTLVADLVGDRSPEVAVATLEPAREDGREGRVEVFDGRGRSLLGARVLGLDGPDLADEVGGIRLKTVELLPDRKVLASIALHATAYPSALWLWDGRGQRAPLRLYRSSGHIYTVRAVDLYGDDRRELVVVSINNPIGFQTLLAILELVEGVTVDTYRSYSSPDDGSAWLGLSYGGSAQGMFVPLGETDGSPELRTAGRDGIVVATRQGELRLDPHGNPEGSPLYGRGPAPRTAAWDALAALCETVEAGAVETTRRWRELEAAHRAALSEPGMRLAATLLVARSLARAGHHRQAVELLEEARASDPVSGDLRLRLAEQLVVLGEGERGSALLLGGRRLPGRGRTASDEPWTVAFSAAHREDEADLQAVMAWLRPRELVRDETVAGVQALWAFCRGRWGDPSLDARPPTPWGVVPELLRQWAALERGDSPPAAVAARAESLAQRPEHRPLARLLGAAAEHRRGEAERALGLAEQAAEELDRRGRTEVEAFVWRGLAERVLADCHAARGEADEAARHLARARSLAPRCWFGQVGQGSLRLAAAGQGG